MKIEEFLKEWYADSPFVRVKTSGSTGRPKEMLVEKKRMLASARMTNDFLGLRRGDSALLCMSVDYIAGKMMVVRSIERGLRLTAVEPSGHPLKGLSQGFDFVAMVPSQVYNTLQVEAERELLRQCRNIIIGGGAIPHELERQLTILSPFKGRSGGVFFSTFGMTETLSHVAMRRIGEEWYRPMPGVSVSLNAEGCLCIEAPHLCEGRLETHDIAELSEGGFRLRGRLDNVICSGGIKIQAEEVERMLEPHIRGRFAVTKRPDEKFGEAVVLVAEQPADLSEIESICRRVLPRYWVPKDYRSIESIPMTETGKIARHRLHPTPTLTGFNIK